MLIPRFRFRMLCTFSYGRAIGGLQRGGKRALQISLILPYSHRDAQRSRSSGVFHSGGKLTSKDTSPGGLQR